MTKPPRYNFQYFDQESDFGFEKDGERIRKKKRPGRKPNPPSLQERRAQNRAAQKAFREREQQRRQEKEEEWQQCMQELEMLRKKLREVQYEANYLRGYVLLLALICLTERGSVPHVYSESRMFPIPLLPYQLGPGDDLDHFPSILRNILEPNGNHILNFENAVMQAKLNGCVFPPESEDIFQDGNAVPLNHNTQDVSKLFPKPKKKAKPTTDKPSPCMAKEKITEKPIEKITRDSHTPPQKLRPDILQSNPSELMVKSSTATQPVYGTIDESPTLKTPDDLAHMPSLQALHILRLQLKCASILGTGSRIAFTPTALQRLIPHDVRIDYVPGPSLRDRMILFQGLYDTDEVVQQLTSQTLFIGGDVRNERNWVVPASFSEKYWFLSHQLVDIRKDECAKFEDLIYPAEMEGEDSQGESLPSLSGMLDFDFMGSEDKVPKVEPEQYQTLTPNAYPRCNLPSLDPFL